jgi:hypothetical protein
LRRRAAYAARFFSEAPFSNRFMVALILACASLIASPDESARRSKYFCDISSGMVAHKERAHVIGHAADGHRNGLDQRINKAVVQVGGFPVVTRFGEYDPPRGDR